MAGVPLRNGSQWGPVCPWAQLYLKGSFQEEEASGLRTVLARQLPFTMALSLAPHSLADRQRHTPKSTVSTGSTAALGLHLATMQKKPVICVVQGPSAVRSSLSPMKGPWTRVLSTKPETLLSVSFGFSGKGNSGNSRSWVCRKHLC